MNVYYEFSARKIYYTIQQKQQFLRQYWQIKQKHPELFDIQIARMLKISERDLAIWKFKFGKKETDGEPVKIGNLNSKEQPENKGDQKKLPAVNCE